MAVYGIVALAAVVENFFPPAPADLIITLAAFLSGRGSTHALTVFWITWVANVGGRAPGVSSSHGDLDRHSSSPARAAA